MRIAVLGSNGFIGSNVIAAGRARGLDISGVATVRVADTDGADASGAVTAWKKANPDDFVRQTDSLRGFDVVINAAGTATPAAGDRVVLLASNVVQPAVAASAAFQAGVRRFVHVSSAAVQGRLDPLDETSRHAPLSPYGRSKAAGERWLFDAAGRGGAVPAEIVVYRPTSVHAPGRPATRALARLAARLPAFPLGGAGDQAVPVALIGNVGAGIVHAATMAPAAPIVLQPWEGLTCRVLLELFGARRFVCLPEGLVRTGGLFARRVRGPLLTSRLRWLELTLAGQEVRAGALAAAGFMPPLGREAWDDLVEQDRILGERGPAVAGTVPDSPGLR